eukprot:6937214-Lingulodinium_polyedra.AAC.1
MASRWPVVGQSLASRSPGVCQSFASHWPVIGQALASHWPVSHGHGVFDCWPPSSPRGGNSSATYCQ